MVVRRSGGTRGRGPAMRVIAGAALVAASLLLVTTNAFAGDDVNGRTTLDGVFTEEQAEGARSLFARECAVCHGNNLGGTASAPALRGFAFEFFWNGKTLAELVTYTQSTMPLNSPGTLTESNVVNLVALILLENGFTAGEVALPVEMEVLQSITFVEPEGEE